MLATIATLRGKDRFQSLFYAVAMEMAAAVNANEEGCLSYEIFHGENPKHSSLSNAAGTRPKRNLSAIISILKLLAPAWAPSWPDG